MSPRRNGSPRRCVPATGTTGSGSSATGCWHFPAGRRSNGPTSSGRSTSSASPSTPTSVCGPAGRPVSGRRSRLTTRVHHRGRGPGPGTASAARRTARDAVAGGRVRHRNGRRPATGRLPARRLALVHEALTHGLDVRGFFHWTGVDNYEWLLGYDVSFGLFDLARNRRDSAAVLAAEALSQPGTNR